MVEDGAFIPGSVCSIVVSTADPVSTRQFYSSLFGWTYQVDRNPRSRRYTTALLDGQLVAGITALPAHQREPATWTIYLTSANIADTARAFDRRGGRVLSGPANLPGRGSLFRGADPTGSVVGCCQPTTRRMLHTRAPGTLIWAELNTWNGKQADNFYADLFGYLQRQIGDGDQVDYTTWSLGGDTILGRLQMSNDWASGIQPHWLLHFAVDPQTGTDGVADRVRELGGQVTIAPYDTEMGRIARVQDPSGASFALIDPTIRVPLPPYLAAGPARVDDPYDD